MTNDSAMHSLETLENSRESRESRESKGQVFICPIASSLSRLKGLDEFSGDFLQLDSTISKDKILAFYKQEFFSVCDYCRDMWESGESIAPAIQTKEVFGIEKMR